MDVIPFFIFCGIKYHEDDSHFLPLTPILLALDKQRSLTATTVSLCFFGAKLNTEESKWESGRREQPFIRGK